MTPRGSVGRRLCGVALCAVMAAAVLWVPGAAGAASDADFESGAVDLGDITGFSGPRFPKYTLGGDASAVDRFRFRLTVPKKVGVGLHQLDVDADLLLGGGRLGASENAGTASEGIELTLAAGTYVITVRAVEAGANTYALRYGVTDPETETDPVPETETVGGGPVREGVVDLGDVAGLSGPRFPRFELDGVDGSVGWFRFSLSSPRRVDVGLRQLDADADLFLSDGGGGVLGSSDNAGTANEKVELTLLEGEYFVEVRAQEAGANSYVLRYGVSAADPGDVEGLRQALTRPLGITFTGDSPDDGSDDDGSPRVVVDQEPLLFAAQSGGIDGARALVRNEHAGGDLDGSGALWFAVDVVDSYRYEFEVSLSDSATVSEFTLRLAAETLIARSAGTGSQRAIEWTSNVAGTVYLRLRGDAARYSVVAWGRGPALGWDQTPASWQGSDTPPDATTDALVLVGGIFNDGTVADPNDEGRYRDSIDFGGDTDFVKVWLDTGVRYQIDMLGQNNPWENTGFTLERPELRGLYDHNANYISRTQPQPWDPFYQDGPVSRIVHTPAQAGWHYIAASTANGPHTGTYAIQVLNLDTGFNSTTTPPGPTSISEPSDQDFADDIDSINSGEPFGRLTLRNPATGNASTDSDFDYYEVVLPEIRNYRITVRGDADTNPGSTLKNPGFSVYVLLPGGSVSISRIGDHDDSPDGVAADEVPASEAQQLLEGKARIFINIQTAYDFFDTFLPFLTGDAGTYTVYLEAID